MAVLRFTRDKRGYEYFYLVQPPQRRDKSPGRVLYWFRTPPNLKVGREPFDEAIRRELEARNPGVAFDWRRILETPIPSADAEKWRERRRQEKAARLARRASGPTAPADSAPEDMPEPSADERADEEPEGDVDEPVEHVLEAAADAIGVDPKDPAAEGADPDLTVETVGASPPDTPPAPVAAAGPSSQRRQRRRRRRRRHGPPVGGGGASGPPAGDV